MTKKCGTIRSWTPHSLSTEPNRDVNEQCLRYTQSIRDGKATDEDRKRLKSLREQYIALSKEVEDVDGQTVDRKTPASLVIGLTRRRMTVSKSFFSARCTDASRATAPGGMVIEPDNPRAWRLFRRSRDAAGCRQRETKMTSRWRYLNHTVRHGLPAFPG